MKNQEIKNARRKVFAIVFTAVMTAASIILARLLVISTPITRFEIGFLPLAIVGNLFGPFYSGVGYVLADFLGQLLFQTGSAGINPLISLCKLLTGVLMGVGFYGKKNTLLRSVVVFAVINVVVDFVLMSAVFILWFGYPFWEAVALRAMTAGINLPIRIFTYYGLCRALEKPMDKLKNTYQKS